MPGEPAPLAPVTRRDVLTIPPVFSGGQVQTTEPDADHIQTRSFPGRLDQVREARAFAAGFTGGSPVADDVVLCVSELAANAVVHSHTREYGGRFTVRIEVHAPDYTWVEIEDGGGPWEPRQDADLAGHGLDIVAKLASEWGIDGSLHGWIVWARLDWPAP
jgi:anti-sigma regulatory factor (Ser/Thr protein kinase)